MPAASDRPLTRICVRLWEADYDKIQEVAQARNVSSNFIIRQIVHSFVLHLSDNERKALDNLPTVSIDLGEILKEEDSTDA